MPRASVSTILRCLAVLAFGQAVPAGAAEFPSEPVRFVVGYPAGGSTDIAARIIADKLSGGSPQRFFVDNRAGAGGIIGATAVAKSPPDAHSFLFAASPEAALVKALNRKVDYDPRTSFTPVGMIGQVPFILAINPDVPAPDLKSFIAYVQAHPGRVNFASFGVGTSNHLMGELFKFRMKADLVHVPYRGSAPAMTDLLGGRVQMAFDTVPVLLPYIQSGQLRALGVAMSERSALAPEIPTLAEAGLPNFEGGTWFALFGPPGMDRDRVAQLNGMMTRALTAPETRKALVDRGIIPTPSSPEALTAFIEGEIRRWSDVVKEAGIVVE